jgi:hypothetical protein
MNLFELLMMAIWGSNPISLVNVQVQCAPMSPMPHSDLVHRRRRQRRTHLESITPLIEKLVVAFFLCALDDFWRGTLEERPGCE